MSTRSTVHFINPERDERHIVYVHHDGYPSYRGEEIMEFLKICRDEIADSRIGDAGRLAAKFVVYQFDQHYQRAKESDYREAEHPMQTISVLLCNEDPGDIQYRYIVDCDTAGGYDSEDLPDVWVQGVSRNSLLGGGENVYHEGESLVKILNRLKND